MVSVKDRAGTGACTKRAYAFDVNGNRTGVATSVHQYGNCDAAPTSTTTKTWSYDGADRVLMGANSTGAYVYDALGRQTTIPAIDTSAGQSGGDVRVEYFDDDLARSVSQDGKTTTFTLDTAGRRATQTTTGAGTTVVKRHYTDASDNPGWAEHVTGTTSSVTRYVAGIDGDLGATVTTTGTQAALVLQVADPQGSIATTLSVNSTGLAIGALGAWDEYGNTITTGPAAGAISYGWLGAKERASEPVSALTLMSARLYNSVTGQFTSRDPITGGNTTAYAYPQDPINKTDLDGKWSISWRKAGSSLWKNRGTIGTVVGGALCIAGGLLVCAAGAALGWAARSHQRGFTRKNLRANAIDGMMTGLGFGLLKTTVHLGRYGGKHLVKKVPSPKLFTKGWVKSTVKNQAYNSPYTTYNQAWGYARKKRL